MTWEDPKFSAILGNLVRLYLRVKVKGGVALRSTYKVLCSVPRIAKISEKIQSGPHCMPEVELTNLHTAEVKEGTGAMGGREGEASRHKQQVLGRVMISRKPPV